jgi:mRNA interferase HigB
VRIVTRKRLLEYGALHPDAVSSLEHWYRVAKHTNFATFSELRGAFPGVDQVGRLTVFNIGGNKARLIAYIVYGKRRIYVRHVLTHKEYDKGKWKEEA